MKKRGQIEDILLFFALIIMVFSALIYYFYFKTGSVPVLKPRKEIKPAEKGVVPPGTFFPSPKPKEEKLQFIKPISNIVYASTLVKIGTSSKPNKYIETYVNHKYKNLFNIETNKVEFELYGKNLKNPNERLNFAYLLLPLEKNWKITYSNKLILDLPKKSQIYILLVSAVNNKNEYDPTPIGITFKINISSYFDSVKISSLSNGNLIKITNYSNNEIKITNWRIVSSYVNLLIPKAVEFVDPDKKYVTQDIILKPGESIKIIGSTSPLFINFKPNKCFAYLVEQNQNIRRFLDYIPYICDNFSKEELFDLKKEGYSMDCIYVLEKARCTGIQKNDLSKIIYDYKCLNLINSRFNYRACYEKRKNESDFLDKTWYVFIPIKFLYQTRYEEIKLLDEKGLLVNKYIIY